MSDGQITKTTYLGLSSDQDAPQQQQDPFLLVLNGVQAGRQLNIPQGRSQIGRDSPEVLFGLADDSISRKHAEIERRDERVWLHDLGSTNGLFVNERRVERIELARGDVVTMGRTLLKFINQANLEAEELITLLKRATTDDFTGISNKKHFMQRLSAELSRSARHGEPLSVIMFDVDHFKLFNDTYGHLAGDAVLVSMACTVGALMRKQDLLARFGGEEFVILAPEINAEQVRRLAERVRAAVAEAPVRYESLVLRATISLGCATYDPAADPPPEPEGLVRRADEQLYLAKSAGRNCSR